MRARCTAAARPRELWPRPHRCGCCKRCVCMKTQTAIQDAAFKWARKQCGAYLSVVSALHCASAAARAVAPSAPIMLLLTLCASDTFELRQAQLRTCTLTRDVLQRRERLALRQRCGEGLGPAVANAVAAHSECNERVSRASGRSVRMGAARARGPCLSVVSALHCGSTTASAMAPSTPIPLLPTLWYE